MALYVSKFPPRTYKKAHRHGSGAHVIILDGRGYSLIWPEEGSKTRIDWQKGNMFVPPDLWFHQHFNAGSEPAIYLALKPGGGRKLLFVMDHYKPLGGVKTGYKQIEYEDEDPEIQKLLVSELAKEGMKIDEDKMPSVRGL